MRIRLSDVVTAYDTLAIALGAFGIALYRIFEASLRAARLQTWAKRTFAGAESESQDRLFDDLLDADLFTMRPTSELPVESLEFDGQEKVEAAYAVGLGDSGRWASYR